jgi:hypothetical protein
MKDELIDCDVSNTQHATHAAIHKDIFIITKNKNEESFIRSINT